MGLQRSIKNHSLAEDLREVGYVVEVAAFLVGALGSWDARNEWAMSLVGINGYYATCLKRLMDSNCVKCVTCMLSMSRGCANSDFAQAYPPMGDAYQ
jgi:hypothetical protein